MEEEPPDLEPWLVSSELLIEHPSPGMPSSQGFLGMHVANLEKLEESAQTLSNGTDLGLEIRKMSMEQKRLSSRRSSVRSFHSNRHSQRLSQHSKMHSRTSSNASSAHLSMAETYSAIHWPDADASTQDSPPIMSIISSSSGWNQLPSRASSSSGGTARYEPSIGTTTGYERILSSTPSVLSDSAPSSTSPPLLATYQNSLISTMQSYDNGSQNEIFPWGFNTSIAPEALRVHNQAHHGRMSSIASTSTYHMRTAFTDFDGVHYSPVEAPMDEDLGGGGQIGLGLESPIRSHPVSELGKIPEEKVEPTEKVELIASVPQAVPRTRSTPLPNSVNMVYYPAPVPIRLNLPKRLTKPKSHQDAKRRTQVINHLAYHDRRSAFYPIESAVSDNEHSRSMQPASSNRQSVTAFAKLPPHLRASVFFDEPSVKHNVAIKHGSAVATLESMLDTAARAPVAHTHNSTPEDDSDAVLRPNPLNRRSIMPYIEAQQSRSSVTLVKPPSIGRSPLPEDKRLSLSDDIGTESIFEVDFGTNEPNDGKAVMNPVSSPPSYPPPVPPTSMQPSGELIHLGGGIEDDRGRSPSEDGGVSIIPPNPEVESSAPRTLLAELQVRKEQLKSRTRTAAAAGPDGMHSTLLQLDSVAQVEEKNRKVKRTTLAWEDPKEEQAQAGAHEDDDEIPLAVLYANENERHGHNHVYSDWDRPLGLIQKKELEESEPLSSRRDRLRSKALPPLPPHVLVVQQGRPTSISSEEETLAQRTRRLKANTTATLPSQSLIPQPLTAGPRPRTLDAAKVAQFPINRPKRDSTIRLLAQTDSPTPNSSADGETLGQRRRRLYKTANASIADRKASLKQQPSPRPDQLTRRSSLANLLGANPVSSSTQSLHMYSPAQSQLQLPAQSNPTQNQPPTGLGLLSQSLQAQSDRKAHLHAANLRASSYMTIPKPMSSTSPRMQTTSQVTAKYGLWPPPPPQQQQPPLQTYYIQNHSPAQSSQTHTNKHTLSSGASPFSSPGTYPS